MKGVCLMLLALMFIFRADSQISNGVKAGVNITDLSGDDVSDDIDNRVGFYAGAFAGIPINKSFAVQPELLWSNKGYKYMELGGKFKTSFNYILIPVMAQYHSKGFYAETGPQIGFLITAKEEGGSIPNEDIKDSFKSTAFSWSAGLGYRLSFGLGFNIRYTIGFGSISSMSHTDLKFNTLKIGVFQSFNLLKKIKTIK